MKVAVTDYSFPDLAVEESILQPAGHTIAAWKERKSAAELPALVADADAVITQFAPVNADVIASMQQARVIVRYGIGVDNVDLAAARRGFRSAMCQIIVSTKWPITLWRLFLRQLVRLLQIATP